MKIKILVISLLATFLCSCAQTKDLWENHKYIEQITHVLSTDDGSKIVIVGQKYHYVFINQYDLSELLNWKHRNLLEFKFNEKFKLSPDNQVTGNYTVVCKCENATPAEIDWLSSKGFDQSGNINFSYFREDSISGILYSSNNMNLSKYEVIKNSYKITLESRHAFDTLAKIAFTPVTIFNDVGNAILYGSALIIASPFIESDSSDNK